MKVLCLYCVMFQYRVGTYSALSRLEGVDFELWHGKSVPGTKRKNYEGCVDYRHRIIPTAYLFSFNKNKIGLPYSPFLFLRLIKYGPDIILTEGASNLLWAFTAFLYAKIFKKKIIWWSLGTLANNRKRVGLRGVLQHFIAYIECHVDAVFTYSTQGEKYFLEEGVPQERIYKAINVVNMQPKLEQLEAAGKQSKVSGFNVAFVGAITKEKKIETLVDVVKNLSEKYPDIHLQIIGDGTYKPNLEDYVRRNAANVDVVFHGRIVEGLNVVLSRYQVLVLPGLGGLAIVDGMLSSLPVISGPADGTELDLIGLDCGFVTEKEMSREFLFEKLDFLYNNPSIVKTMGENAYKRITGEYSFESYMAVFHNCIKEVYGK